MKRLPALIVLVAALAPSGLFAEENQLSRAETLGGWELLFDGKTSNGWRNYKKDSISDGWKVVDGAIVRSARGAGDIITEKKYGEFELSLEYRISKGGNSGVMFHVTEQNGAPWHSGPEIQVQDNVDGHDPQKAGWLYQLYQPGKDAGGNLVDATRPAGQWNQLYIRISKDQSEVCMNGVRYYRFKLGSKDWQGRVAKSKFAKFEGFGSAGEGHICLQDHGNEVAYRNIKVRELGPGGSVPAPIDGKLDLPSTNAFPNLVWDNWQAIDDSGVSRPLRLMELTHVNGDDRLFAASQQGAIWAFKNDPNVTKSHMVLDLRGKVYDWRNRGANEQGLLGLALHPKFKSNGHFYVYYSHPSEEKSVVSRFTISSDDPNRADPASEQIVMEIDQPFQNHNGGAIEFGPDGYLYIALGDGGFRNDPNANGQNIETLLGSILRIDVDSKSDGKNYGIPSDNPFVGVDGARGEIYAIGIRNAWRIGFDKKTGLLWCADVGQELWEEINIITKGGNYGWSNREGTHAFGNRPNVESAGKPIDPVWEYDHRVGRSITGGRVYNSSRVPSLTGKYLYADYVTGTVWALSYDVESGKATHNEMVLPKSIPVLAFGEDQTGEVYYLTENARGHCINRFDAATK